MTKKEEAAYSLGREQAYARILSDCAQELGVKTDAGQVAILLSEQQRIRAAIRMLCNVVGITQDFDDKMSICDIIDRHIARSLESKR